MKKWTVFLLVLCLLAGCGRQDPVDMTTEQTTAAAPETTEAPTLPARDILDSAETVSEEGNLLKVSCPSLEKMGYADIILIWQDQLVFGATDYSGGEEPADNEMIYRVALTDLQTGDETAFAEFPVQGASTLQAGEDCLILCDSSGNIRKLDGSLQQTEKYQVNSDEWSVTYTDPLCRTAYTFPAAGQGLQVTDLATGKESRLFPTALGLYSGRLQNEFLTINYEDPADGSRHGRVLNLATGEFLEPPFAGGTLAACTDGLWLNWLDTTNGTYLLGRDDDPLILQTDNQNFMTVHGPAALFGSRSLSETDMEASLYREDGTAFSAARFEVPEGGYLTEPLWCPEKNGYFLAFNTYFGDSQLLFWDVSVPAEGQDLNARPMSALAPEPGETVAGDLYDRAAELSERFGVTVRIADQCDTEYLGYNAVQVIDGWTISAALDALETALEAYPENFMPQLIYGEYLQTEINLMGHLTPTGLPENAVGFTSFAGFVTNDGWKHTMVLDISQPDLEQTIYHEFSHIIDNKLAEQAWSMENAMFDEGWWSSLNPSDFSYSFDLYNTPEEAYWDGYDSWFVDSYARTFPTEDRARILEYAMAGYDWMFSEDGYAPLREKLAYYSACIRDSFDTEGWPEETAWEKPLNGYRFSGSWEPDYSDAKG